MKLMCAAFAAVRLGFIVVAVYTASLQYVVAQSAENLSADATAQHRENVLTMLELMGVPAQVNKAIDGVARLYAAKVDDNNTDENVQKIVDAYQTDLRKTVERVLGWEALKPIYITAYASKLTASEVEAINGFLVSQIGQKYSAASVQASSDIEQITRHLAQEDLAPTIAQLARQLREGLRQIQNPKDEN